MLSINTTYSSLIDPRLTTRAASAVASLASNNGSNDPARRSGGSSTQISASARQLSEASTRADTRDGMAHQQLSQKATELLQQISGEGYLANKALLDAEVPATDDPSLLSRAKQATDFLNANGVNPFKALPRDQLALIVYDDSGAYTTNERRAASMEADKQEFAWRQNAVQTAMNEYNVTGKLTKFFSDAKAHYEALPKIEQVQYPEDYASKLQNWVDQDFNYREHVTEGGSKMSISGIIMGALSKLEDGLTEGRIERVTPGAFLKRVTDGALRPLVVESPAATEKK